MFAVIFKARTKQFDEAYSTTAARLRTLAMEDFGCIEFISCSEGEDEIAISYWESEEQIRAWKQHPEHRAAQMLGKEKWYRDYQVQVVEVLRDYGPRGASET
jgi:heme-degrading monooxygenase HmoA